MKKVRGIISFILVICLLLSISLSLSSCDRSYDKAEVEAAARQLLPKALTLYSIYYGSGLGYISSGFRDGEYCEADPTSLRKYGFVSIAELKNLTLLTFSNKYSESLFNTYLEFAYDSDGNINHNARYTENATGEYILVHSKYAGQVFDDRMEYKLDTVSANDSERDYVKLSICAIVKNEKGESKEITLSFSMYEEKIGWRISSPCFGNYR